MVDHLPGGPHSTMAATWQVSDRGRTWFQGVPEGEDPTLTPLPRMVDLPQRPSAGVHQGYDHKGATGYQPPRGSEDDDQNPNTAAANVVTYRQVNSPARAFFPNQSR